MAEHTMRQMVSEAAMNAEPTVRKLVACKLIDGLMKAVETEALFGETIVSLGPITERKNNDMLAVCFEQSVSLTPLVRCKDCRYRDPEDKKCDSGALERAGCLFPVDDDYFCADGERKDGGQDDV